MINPYTSLPDYAFWRRSVAQLSVNEVDPITQVPFYIERHNKIATAGSCFAQHISNTLVKEGMQYLVTETEPLTNWANTEGFGVFPARFGNIYTTRQFLQLFQRAYGLFEPKDVAWTRPDGVLVDPFRPRIQEQGYPSVEAVDADRRAHLGAVRSMFETCDVLIFTLGLTESWLSLADGAAFPIAPGVVAQGADPQAYRFHNLTVPEMVDDLVTLIDHVRVVNQGLKVILTVSPVPLVATYEDRHVLVSTTYSKSALRVVAEMTCAARGYVAYFPSYEIITGSYNRSKYFADDLREVTPEGVGRVMSLFKKHYLGPVDGSQPPARVLVRQAPVASTNMLEQSAPKSAENSVQAAAYSMRELQAVICDEEVLDQKR